MQYRVTGHVFNNKQEDTRLASKLVFHTSDYTLANDIAGGIGAGFNNHTVNVDVEASVRTGRKLMWVNANPRELDAVSAQLMELASSIREQRKPRAA